MLSCVRLWGVLGLDQDRSIDARLPPQRRTPPPSSATTARPYLHVAGSGVGSKKKTAVGLDGSSSSLSAHNNGWTRCRVLCLLCGGTRAGGRSVRGKGEASDVVGLLAGHRLRSSTRRSHPSIQRPPASRSPSVDFDDPAFGWWLTCRLSRLPTPSQPPQPCSLSLRPRPRNAASHWWLSLGVPLPPSEAWGSSPPRGRPAVR